MNKSKRILIWLVIALILAGVSLFFQFWRSISYSSIIVAIIPFIIALLLLFRDYIESSIDEQKKKKFVNSRIKEILSNLQKFFSFVLRKPEIDDYNTVDDIYRNVIQHNFKKISDTEHRAILLCFYCYLWGKERSPQIYGKIQEYATSLSLSFAELNEEIKQFLNFYWVFVLKKEVFNSVDEILKIHKTEDEYSELLRDFSNRYLKDLTFFEIRDKLYQSENLRKTLIKLIKDEKFFNWGITRESLERLEKDLEKEISYSKTFLIIGDKLPEKLKTYLKDQPGFTGWPPVVRNIPLQGRYSGYIVRPNERFINAKEFLKKIKKFSEDSEEMVVFIVPLDFINSESYIFPANQSFKSENIQRSFEAIEWFKSGYVVSDADLWSAITKSTITIDELLSVIPFNIFCQGILPCEQEFFIKNYKEVKEKYGINKLTEWRDKKPELIVSYLLEYGYPDYNKYEKEHILTEYGETFDSMVKNRALDLVEQIVTNSGKLFESLHLTRKQ